MRCLPSRRRVRVHLEAHEVSLGQSWRRGRRRWRSEGANGRHRVEKVPRGALGDARARGPTRRTVRSVHAVDLLAPATRATEGRAGAACGREPARRWRAQCAFKLYSEAERGLGGRPGLKGVEVEHRHPQAAVRALRHIHFEEDGLRWCCRPGHIRRGCREGAPTDWAGERRAPQAREGARRPALRVPHAVAALGQQLEHHVDVPRRLARRPAQRQLQVVKGASIVDTREPTSADVGEKGRSACVAQRVAKILATVRSAVKLVF